MTPDLHDRINRRAMPRTDAETALRKRTLLKAEMERIWNRDLKAARKTAERNMESWGVSAEDVGVGDAAWRREVESGASDLARDVGEKRGINWDALMVQQTENLHAALQVFGLQERCPLWWVLEDQLHFCPEQFGDLRRLGWVDASGLHRGSLLPHQGVAPLRVVAAYSRGVVMGNRALPEVADAGTPGPFMLLREVGMIRRDRRGEEGYYTLGFSDPARPYAFV